MKTVYLDNAATTHPKPENVYRAQDESFRRGGSPGRSAHHLSLEASRTVFDARVSVARLVGAASPERIIFTPGCTYSINWVLKGLRWQSGDIVCVSALEHNAVMRPLAQLTRSSGIRVTTIPYSRDHFVDLVAFRKLLEEQRPALCAIQEASNVTGQFVDLPAVDEICREANVPLLVDAAQTAGIFHGDLNALSVSYWCASGHKGLLGAPGVGVLYVRPDLDLEPLVAGGTGSRSEDVEMPVHYPDRLEAGTPPAGAIAALGAGAEWLLQQNRQSLADHEVGLAREFIARMRSNERLNFIARDVAKRLAVVSFSVRGMDSGSVAEYLDHSYGICVRPGLHCAASAHRTLGTLESGLVRVSFGCFNTEEDLDMLCSALSELP